MNKEFFYEEKSNNINERLLWIEKEAGRNKQEIDHMYSIWRKSFSTQGDQYYECLWAMREKINENNR